MTDVGSIELASIVTAFDDVTIGSKVTNSEGFFDILIEAVRDTDFEDQRVPGQAYIPLPEDTCDFVSAGVGRHTDNPEDYIKHLYRGQVKLFLSRQQAVPVESVAAVVYTREAYLSDPDVASKAEEVARLYSIPEATHVLVAVLASAGPRSPLSPGRLVHNLAGGNKEAMEWSADEIREKAKESSSYYGEWGTVAD